MRILPLIALSLFLVACAPPPEFKNPIAKAQYIADYSKEDYNSEIWQRELKSCYLANYSVYYPGEIKAIRDQINEFDYSRMDKTLAVSTHNLISSYIKSLRSSINRDIDILNNHGILSSRGCVSAMNSQIQFYTLLNRGSGSLWHSDDPIEERYKEEVIEGSVRQLFFAEAANYVMFYSYQLSSIKTEMDRIGRIINSRPN